jgi:HCOMODA/2-hydroxy-3-carboxy-muconic semialdehyde decarboxylase
MTLGFARRSTLTTPAMPTTPPPPDLVTTLVVANRILYRHGVVDGFGHVSVRDPGASDRFLLSRSLAPGQVTAADVMTFDLDGNPQNGDARQPYLERFIHGEIYRARPDVGSVVHSHSPSVTVRRDAPRAEAVLPHELVHRRRLAISRPEAGGDTDMLDPRPPLGGARALAGGSRGRADGGHGSTVVGASIEAVFRAIYTEMNARL